jgi:phenylalanyl-tRNA synthetase beta chain
VSREADLIEEVGRHWGFDRIPATFPSLHAPPREMSPVVSRDRLLRRVLCGAGLQETCTFTFIEQGAAEPFSGTTGATGTTGTGGLVSILNPLSEKFAVLRPSLLPGLLDALVYSRRRETEHVRLFEAGTVFLPSGEVPRVAWVQTGDRSEHWSGHGGPADVFDATGLAELVGEAFGVPVVARATNARPWFVRGRAADLFILNASGADTDASGATPIGSAGELRPELVAARGLGAGAVVVGGEIDPSALARAASARTERIEPLPRFPSIVRDLSVVIDRGLPAADVRGTIRSIAPRTLVSIREFDRYDGKGVPDGMISLSLRLTFRDRDRTLTDAEVQQAVDAIVTELAARHGAVLR